MSSASARLGLWLSTLLMESCWVGAWAALVMTAATGRSLPIADAGACALLASLITRPSGRGALSVARVGVHVGLLAVFVLRDLQLSLAIESARARWSVDWSHGLSRSELREGGRFVWLALSTAVMWLVGSLHARRPRTYAFVCARFDLGMYWLLSLLCGRLLLRDRPELPVSVPDVDALAVFYFAVGIGAVALARAQGGASKHWLRVSGRVATSVAGIGAALGVVLLSGWFARPLLRALSDSVYGGAARVVVPPLNALADLLLYIMSRLRDGPMLVVLPGRGSSEPGGGAKATRMERVASAPDSTVDSADLLFVIGLAFLFGVGLVFWFRRRTWLKRGGGDDPLPLAWLWWLGLLAAVRSWLRRIRPRYEPEPLRLYRALLRWGQRSGLPRDPAETPHEYAQRLRGWFASEGGEIDLIVASYQRHAYALTGCDSQSLVAARRALRRLQSPRHWWARALAWWSNPQLASAPQRYDGESAGAERDANQKRATGVRIGCSVRPFTVRYLTKQGCLRRAHRRPET